MPSVQKPLTVAPDALPALLDEAFNAPRRQPTPARRAEIHGQLRAEADRLAPLVQAQAGRINRGTRAWYSRDKALADTRAAQAADGGTDGLNACIRLAQLARVVRALDDYAGGEE